MVTFLGIVLSTVPGERESSVALLSCLFTIRWTDKRELHRCTLIIHLNSCTNSDIVLPAGPDSALSVPPSKITENGSSFSFGKQVRSLLGLKV